MTGDLLVLSDFWRVLLGSIAAAIGIAYLLPLVFEPRQWGRR